jgi:hypothetical protein
VCHDDRGDECPIALARIKPRDRQARSITSSRRIAGHRVREHAIFGDDRRVPDRPQAAKYGVDGT